MLKLWDLDILAAMWFGLGLFIAVSPMWYQYADYMAVLNAMGSASGAVALGIIIEMKSKKG